jgi:hypothetical protein
MAIPLTGLERTVFSESRRDPSPVASPVQRGERRLERSIDGKWVVECPAFGLEFRADLACFSHQRGAKLSVDDDERIGSEIPKRNPDLAVPVGQFSVAVGSISWLIVHGLGL